MTTTPKQPLKPQTYRARPVSVEAVQWDGTEEKGSQIVAWVKANGKEAFLSENLNKKTFKLGIDGIWCHPGEFIVQNRSNFHVMDVGTFYRIYLPAPTIRPFEYSAL